MFEEFKNNTITKNDFVAGLGDKADKEEIANIVSFKILYTLLCRNLGMVVAQKNSEFLIFWRSLVIENDKIFRNSQFFGEVRSKIPF